MGGAAALALLLAAWPTDAGARPGGGQSYSGGSHSYSGGSHSYSGGSSYRSSGGSYSGGGGGGGGMTDSWLFVIGVVGFVVFGMLRDAHDTSQDHAHRWSSVGFPSRLPPPPPRSADLGVLRQVDPEFSVALFEDFVHALYARVHEARRDPAAMAALAPYVAAESREALLRRDPAGVPIHGVVIGAMQVVHVLLPRGGASTVRVELKFEANYTATLEHGQQGYYIEERWALERDAGARTRPPVDVLAFGCPSCGAPFHSTDADRCAHCGKKVGDGRFDWTVTFVRALNQEWRPPALTSDVAEQGTDLPTVVHTEAQARLAALVAEDPGATLEQIERRVRAIYAALNAGWTARDLGPTRPFVSDAIYNSFSYWIAAYKAQGLRNVLQDMEVSRVELVRVERDRHYDAVTVRVFADGLDYTVRDSDGRRVSGSETYPRRYSEYWTLIRGAGVRGAPRDPARCPNCGAALDRVNMAGNCEYCSAHLTRGEFDWVLSKIEQDEAYTG